LISAKALVGTYRGHQEIFPGVIKDIFDIEPFNCPRCDKLIERYMENCRDYMLGGLAWTVKDASEFQITKPESAP
jgi:hypothetical protein